MTVALLVVTTFMFVRNWLISTLAFVRVTSKVTVSKLTVSNIYDNIYNNRIMIRL